MKLQNKWLLTIVPINLLIATAGHASSQQAQDVLAFLSSLPKSSSSITSPFAGRINTQFKPMQQQSPWQQATKQSSQLALPSINKLKAQPQPIMQTSIKLQDTKNSNGTKTTDYFDNSGKNISRIEIDAHGKTAWFINFYHDGTQSKTMYNPDGTQTFSYFGADLKNTSTTKLDQHGRTMSIININPDKTAIEAIYNPDKSQTIITFDASGKSSSRTEFNAQEKPTQKIEFHANGTQTKTMYDSDRTQTISEYGIDKKCTSIIEINAFGICIKKSEFHTDGSQSHTIYHQDKTQTTDHRNGQGKRISLTRIHANGTRINASAQLITAWHEAAHAISHTHNDTLSLINYITIKPQELISVNGQSIKTEGHVQASRKYRSQKTIEEIDNKIITAICGAVGEQLLMQETMLTKPQEILDLLSQPPYTDDMLQARQDAKELLTMNSLQYNVYSADQKIDEILIRLYKQAYQFIAKHTAEVKKIADVLVEKETLHSEETYKLLNLKQPWTTT